MTSIGPAPVRSCHGGRVTIWLDIENPPQVQYLLPFRATFAAMGAEVVLTARDYGNAVELLGLAGAGAYVFGSKVGRGRARKARAAATRARQLLRFFEKHGRPHAVLGASRAAAIAAWSMDIPSYVITDYEHAHAAVYRLTGTTVLYPDIIPRARFRRRGLRAAQLVAFRGLKEDLSFAGVAVDAVEPYDVASSPGDPVRVLFRPPSETSHYYRAASTKLARATLEHLARKDAVVVLAPRHRGQARLVEGLRFTHEPVLLTKPVPFVSLLKSVDAVVCGGGTMLREAAYLGIPCYSIFQSKMGAVDCWLENIGRATLLRGCQDLPRIQLKRRGALKPLDSNPDLLRQLAKFVIGASTERPCPVSYPYRSAGV